MITFTSKQLDQWDFFSKIEYAKKEGMKEGLKEGIKEGIAEGMKEGEALGIHKSQIATARKLKAKGLSDELIEETTGLILAEIKKL